MNRTNLSLKNKSGEEINPNFVWTIKPWRMLRSVAVSVEIELK